MTPKQAAEALAKARDLTQRAHFNWQAAENRPGTKSARLAAARGDKQHAEADALFDQIRQHLEGS